MGDESVKKINDEYVMRLKQKLNQIRAGPAYKNSFLVLVRNILQYMEQVEHEKVFDYRKIKKFKEENKPVEFLTDEEVDVLLNSIEERCVTKLRLKTLIICLLSTGSRISAMLSLNKDDIDWQNGIASCKGKGGKINQLIFNEVSREYLKRYLEIREDRSQALFATSNGNRWSVNCAERAVRNQGRRAGIKKRVYLHIFRKVAASKMFFSGAPLPVVSRFLSHSDLATTQKYYLRGASFEEVKQYHGSLNYGSPIIKDDSKAIGFDATGKEVDMD
jgi:integrase/recombinase XerD